MARNIPYGKYLALWIAQTHNCPDREIGFRCCFSGIDGDFYRLTQIPGLGFRVSRRVDVTPADIFEMASLDRGARVMRPYFETLT